jgi:hypothetical protein
MSAVVRTHLVSQGAGSNFLNQFLFSALRTMEPLRGTLLLDSRLRGDDSGGSLVFF